MLAILLNQPVFVACKSKVVLPHALTRCMRTYVPSISDDTYIYKERFSNMKNSRVQISRIETMGASASHRKMPITIQPSSRFGMVLSRLINNCTNSIRWLDFHFFASSENLENERSSPRGFSTIWLRFLSVAVLLLRRESIPLVRCASTPNGAAIVIYKRWGKVVLLLLNELIFSCTTA